MAYARTRASKQTSLIFRFLFAPPLTLFHATHEHIEQWQRAHLLTHEFNILVITAKKITTFMPNNNTSRMQMQMFCSRYFRYYLIRV